MCGSKFTSEITAVCGSKWPFSPTERPLRGRTVELIQIVRGPSGRSRGGLQTPQTPPLDAPGYTGGGPVSVGSKIFFLKILLDLVNKSAKNKNDILIGSDGRIFYMLVEN